MNLSLGSSVSFTVTVSGPGPFTYQWRFNGTNIPGASNINYSITNVQPAHAGNYTVVVTNLAGAATSQVAVLTVGFVSMFILASLFYGMWCDGPKGDVGRPTSRGADGS